MNSRNGFGHDDGTINIGMLTLSPIISVGHIRVVPSVLYHWWLGERKDIWPNRNLCHSSTKILFQNKWRNKPRDEVMVLHGK